VPVAAFKTVHDRQNVAGRLADQLKKLNIQIKAVSHLKSKHIESYISTRKEDGIGLRTLQNEMAGIRGILREAGRDTLADSERISNNLYRFTAPVVMENIKRCPMTATNNS
jgi:hypothetical protein